jgi:hypothetical protein
MTKSLGLDPALANLKLDYQGVVCAVFLLRKPLSSLLLDAARGQRRPRAGRGGDVEPGSRSTAVNGLYVTYLLNYTHRSSALFNQPDEQILAGYRKDLADLFPDAGRTIVDEFLFRAPFVEPIWSVG